jgi:hypothetical protein
MRCNASRLCVASSIADYRVVKRREKVALGIDVARGKSCNTRVQPATIL